MRVGTRNKRLEELAKEGDHPHACGDKSAKQQPPIVVLGSSPCVWGQDFHNLKFDGTFRIIPMRVGTRMNGIKEFL